MGCYRGGRELKGQDPHSLYRVPDLRGECPRAIYRFVLGPPSGHRSRDLPVRAPPLSGHGGSDEMKEYPQGR